MMHRQVTYPRLDLDSHNGGSATRSCRRTAPPKVRSHQPCVRNESPEGRNRPLARDPAKRPQQSGPDGTGSYGCLRIAAGLPPRIGRSRRPGGDGASHRLRQRRQPDDSTGRGKSAGDGPARLRRRGKMAPGADGPCGERAGSLSLHRPAERCSRGGPRLLSLA